MKFVTAGEYSRIVKLSGNGLVLVYSNGSKINYRISSDEGNTWSNEVNLGDGGSKYTYTNAAFIELADGTWVYGYNARPNKEGGSDNYQIRIITSHDKGVTWSPEKIVYSGGNVSAQGVWEPAFLQLPSGELQLYFSIEDNGFDRMFKPATIRTDFGDNWSSGVVDGGNKKRNRALAKGDQLSSKKSGSSPYLAQLPNGDTLLFIKTQKDHSKKGLIIRVYIGNNKAENFSSMSTPFTSNLIKANGTALWNSLTVLDDMDVIASSTINTGDSKPNGVYIIKGVVK
ncbi:MAG: exo-alpha-sialidase [Psychromonas sp.]|nr:exo-alpha-sialidase [Psychromonas sp.]